MSSGAPVAQTHENLETIIALAIAAVAGLLAILLINYVGRFRALRLARKRKKESDEECGPRHSFVDVNGDEIPGLKAPAPMPDSAREGLHDSEFVNPFAGAVPDLPPATHTRDPLDEKVVPAENLPSPGKSTTTPHNGLAPMSPSSLPQQEAPTTTQPLQPPAPTHIKFSSLQEAPSMRPATTAADPLTRSPTARISPHTRPSRAAPHWQRARLHSRDSHNRLSTYNTVLRESGLSAK